MIVDVHTHIFPPRMIERRGRLVPVDAGFAELYGNARTRMRSAEALLASMDAAGVDVAVACGFWWRDAALAEEHAAYLLDVAAGSQGRIVAFVPVAGSEPAEAIARAARLGARGLGEVRPGQSDPGLDATLEAAAVEHGLVALVHASEEVGHAYPGKAGGYTPGALWRLFDGHPALRVIAAHCGGGFPFYALMPEVRALIEAGRVAFDTAASPLLYEPRAVEQLTALAGAEALLWGSDFPLRDQARDRAELEAALSDPEARAAVLGRNAARFLGLDGR